MTVRRSRNQSLEVTITALTCNSSWSYGDSNPRPLACHSRSVVSYAAARWLAPDH